MNLTFSEQVKIMLERKGMSINALAKELGTTRQNLSSKLKTNNFDIDWMQRIARALNTNITIALDDFLDVKTHDIAATGIESSQTNRPNKNNKKSTKSKQSKTHETPINPNFLPPHDENYPEHIPGTKVTVEEYSKWKLDDGDRWRLPVPDADLVQPDDVHTWSIGYVGLDSRVWQFAADISGFKTYGNGPSIDKVGIDYKTHTTEYDKLGYSILKKN